MTDISGLALNPTPQVDWDNFNPQTSKSSYVPPPVPVNSDGKPITFIVQFGTDMAAKERQASTKANDRKFKLGPLAIQNSGGSQVRFYDASVKLFVNQKTGETTNVNAIGKVLRAAGIAARPQTDADYCKAVGQLNGRTMPVYLDWEARDPDSNFTVRGYENFKVTRTNPQTGATTTSVQSILRQGDILPDGTVITQEVLFANPIIKTVLDPNRK